MSVPTVFSIPTDTDALRISPMMRPRPDPAKTKRPQAPADRTVRRPAIDGCRHRFGPAKAELSFVRVLGGPPRPPLREKIVPSACRTAPDRFAEALRFSDLYDHAVSDTPLPSDSATDAPSSPVAMQPRDTGRPDDTAADFRSAPDTNQLDAPTTLRVPTGTRYSFRCRTSHTDKFVRHLAGRTSRADKPVPNVLLSARIAAEVPVFLPVAKRPPRTRQHDNTATDRQSANRNQTPLLSAVFSRRQTRSTSHRLRGSLPKESSPPGRNARSGKR